MRGISIKTIYKKVRNMKLSNIFTAICTFVIIALVAAFCIGLLVVATLAVWRWIFVLMEDINVLIAR